MPDVRGGEANGEKRRTSEPPRLLPRTARGGVPSRDADGFGQASPSGASATSGAGTQTKEQRRRTAAATPGAPDGGRGRRRAAFYGQGRAERKTICETGVWRIVVSANYLPNIERSFTNSLQWSGVLPTKSHKSRRPDRLRARPVLLLSRRGG